MDSAQDYIVNSLELHLFFARIMKEHAFFLKVGFYRQMRILPMRASVSYVGLRRCSPVRSR